MTTVAQEYGLEPSARDPTPIPSPAVVPDWFDSVSDGDDEASWREGQTPPEYLEPSEALYVQRRGITSQSRQVKPPPGPALRQAELWKKSSLHKLAVANGLRAEGMWEEAAKLDHCHTVYTVCQCSDCHAVRSFPNRCDLFFCCECQHALQTRREKEVRWWSVKVGQPKHVVLTVRNITDLTPKHVDELRGWFSKLRRRKFARNWRGGFYRIEVTNEGRGWHLHLHVLVDARWIDQAGLRQAWMSITNGYGYICNVKDCRGNDYLREVTKYVVKGSQIAAWPSNQIAEFVRAFSGKRTFGVFGSCYGIRSQFAEHLQAVRTRQPQCVCGSSHVAYFSETDWIIHCECGPRPPPVRSVAMSAASTDLIPPRPRWPD